MDFAYRIKELRETLGLSQREFAEKLGKARRTIQHWESGNITPPENVLRLIEQTFSVNPEWLRHGKGEMFIKKRKETEESDALTELFKAMEKLEGKVPRAVKRALTRAFETKDIEGFAGIMADYLYDLAEETFQNSNSSKILNSKGNFAINSENLRQMYKGGKEE